MGNHGPYMWAVAMVCAASAAGASDGSGPVERALGLQGWEGCDLEVVQPDAVTVASLSSLARPVLLVNATIGAWGQPISRGAALHELLAPAADADVEVRLPLGINQVRCDMSSESLVPIELVHLLYRRSVDEIIHAYMAFLMHACTCMIACSDHGSMTGPSLIDFLHRHFSARHEGRAAHTRRRRVKCECMHMCVCVCVCVCVCSHINHIARGMVTSTLS